MINHFDGPLWIKMGEDRDNLFSECCKFDLSNQIIYIFHYYFIKEEKSKRGTDQCLLSFNLQVISSCDIVTKPQ